MALLIDDRGRWVVITKNIGMNYTPKTSYMTYDISSFRTSGLPLRKSVSQRRHFVDRAVTESAVKLILSELSDRWQATSIKLRFVFFSFVSTYVSNKKKMMFFSHSVTYFTASPGQLKIQIFGAEKRQLDRVRNLTRTQKQRGQTVVDEVKFHFR